MLKILSLVGGMSSVYSIIATIMLGGGVVYHYYDKFVTSPVQYAEQRADKCELTLEGISEDMANQVIMFDANLTTMKSLLVKCEYDTSVIKFESFDKGYIKGLKDGKKVKIKKTDTDAICFQPYF